MRVVAGAAGGRRLVAPPGAGTRPTADRVKEALFSSLQPLLGGARVLDLYAGSGALGIEALSRGAARVVFVEHDPAALAVLRDNLATVGLPGGEVRSTDVLTAVRATPAGQTFDLVLADPPYALETRHLAPVLEAVIGVLDDGGHLVVERGVHSPAIAWPAGLTRTASRRYGDVVLHRAVRVSAGRPTTVGDESSQEGT